MRIVTEHTWDLSPSEAVNLQNQLRDLVVSEPFYGEPRLIAGADVSFNKYSPRIYAGFVVLDFETLKVVGRSGAILNVNFPYIPGLLSFREIPPLLEAWKKLEIEPDVLVVDGQGIAHPRRMGIAAHLGLLIEKPTIGCGKSLLTGSFQIPSSEAGAYSPLMDRGEKVGVAYRSKRRTNPIFISPGHHMDVESARRIVSKTIRGYRIPEPTRFAHHFVNELRRADMEVKEPSPQPTFESLVF